ncbi:DJ-1/PfpI family protein [Sporosarcina aquimarina]|nr:DJ-1/PfpI family protein [Sporosarcina aquimarina]
MYQTNYHTNSLSDNTPYTTSPEEGGYVSFPKKVEGHVIRERSKSFDDFFTQPRIFWNSLTRIEKQHTIEALSYQLGSVNSESVRQQNVDMLVNVDKEMSYIVADNIGVNRPSGSQVLVSTIYPSLSQANTPKYAYSQKVGVLIGNGFNGKEVANVLNMLKEYGVFIVIVSETLGTVTGKDGTQFKMEETFLTTSPYLLDSIYIVGGNTKNQNKFTYDVNEYLTVAYKHYKPIGVASSGHFFIKKSKKTIWPKLFLLVTIRTLERNLSLRLPSSDSRKENSLNTFLKKR